MDPNLEIGLISYKCAFGWYLNFNLVCQPCGSNCLQCETAPAQCTACDQKQNLVLGANNTCVCQQGYQPNAAGVCTLMKDGFDTAMQGLTDTTLAVVGASLLPILMFSSSTIMLQLFDILQMLRYPRLRPLSLPPRVRAC